MSVSPSQVQLVRHSAWTLVQQLLGTLAGLCTTVLIARMLGPSGQGLYGVVATTAMLGSMCINLGTPAATTYAISRGHISPQRALAHTAAVAAVLGGSGALLIALLAWMCPAVLWPGVDSYDLLYAAALVPTLLAAQLLAAILQGAQAFARYNTMALVAPLVTLTTTLMALGLGGQVGSALGCLMLGQLCALVWGVGSIRRLKRADTAADSANAGSASLPLAWRTYLRSLLGFGLMAALANALVYSSYRIDVILLNAWLPRAQVGYYSVAASVAERLWMLSGAVNMVLFAQVARAQGAGPTNAQNDSTPLLVRHVLWIVSLAACVLYAIAPTALPLLFGASYAQSVAPLAALLPGVVVFNVARILSQDLAGRGLVRINVVVGAVCLGLNVLGNVVLIPRFGYVGAAWASTLSYSADTCLMLAFYTRLTGTPWAHLILLQGEDLRRLRGWKK